MAVSISLAGKNAIITGAGSGMGRCTALMLAEAGANILVSDLNPVTAAETAEMAKKFGHKAISCKCDVGNLAEIQAMVDLAVAEFGRIDILNHIAGIFGSVDFLDCTEEEYDRQLDINTKATFFVNQAVMKVMVPQRSGKIVNMCSQAGKHGFPTHVAYTTSKFAVTGMTQSIANWAAPYNINVNCVCPGLVRTAIWEKALNDIVQQGGDPVAYWDQRINAVPLKRAQTVEDIAHVFLYLSSDFADNMTGQAINVTGGRIMH